MKILHVSTHCCNVTVKYAYAGHADSYVLLAKMAEPIDVTSIRPDWVIE
jgi:hypothetical protein